MAPSAWAGRNSKCLLSSVHPPLSAPSSVHPSAITSPPSMRMPPSDCAGVTLRSWSSTLRVSCLGLTQQPPESTPQTQTPCCSGCMAFNWWLSTIRLMVRTVSLGLLQSFLFSQSEESVTSLKNESRNEDCIYLKRFSFCRFSFSFGDLCLCLCPLF